MEKKITPILTIVVLFVLLVSTYAWFSNLSYVRIISNIGTGAPTKIVLGVGDKNDFNIEDLNIPFYQGQKGFDEKGVAYPKEEADYLYAVDVNFLYKAQATSTSTLYVTLDKAVIKVGSLYNLSKDASLELLGINISGFTDDDYKKYISNDTELYSAPTTGNSSVYIVYDNINNKVVAFVFKGEETSKHFEFDYWKSYSQKVNREDSISAKESGILLTYGETISEAGINNYMGLYIGFCGYNTEEAKYNKTFLFSNSVFQGSTFDFYLSAELK